MSYVPGTPQQPVLMTIDGNEFLIIRSKSLMENDLPSVEMKLSPMDWVVGRLGWTDKDLDKREDIFGVVTRTFPESSVVPLSDNAEKPVRLLLSTIEGEKINWDKPNLMPILAMKERLDAKDKLIALKDLEIESLREQNKGLISLTKEYRNEWMKTFGGEQPQTLISDQLTGFKISDGKVKPV